MRHGRWFLEAGWHGIGRADLPVAGTTGWFYVRTSGNVVGTHNYDHQSRHNYFACFNVSGIFVDETATDPSKSNGNDAYYDQLYAYVKSKDPSAEVMCNPGTGGSLNKSGREESSPDPFVPETSGFDYGSWKHCCDRAMVVEVSLSSFTSGFKDPSPFTGPTPYPPGFAVVLALLFALLARLCPADSTSGQRKRNRKTVLRRDFFHRLAAETSAFV